MAEIIVTDSREQFLSQVEDQIEVFLRRVLLKMKNTAEDILSTAGQNGKKFATNSTHELRKNLREDVYREAGKIIGVLGVGANVPYAIYVHEDCKPHFPPLRPIRLWIMQKGFLKYGGDKVNKGFLRKKFNYKRDRLAHREEGKEAHSLVNSVAYAIAKKISIHGTKGLPFLRMALNQNVDWVASQFQTEFQKG